ncbi:hypothetical protein RBSWK_03855 [Rhodopirellula baltica SWK14]|uniref:Protein containing DUF1581 n=2 Tax=Rhodopirellula baltica TaxID=265606 RepID=L7CGG4_RHOBT|nr:hypothetical protein RBSWK_03855 [Rhodopirellula baltica SWK14]
MKFGMINSMNRLILALPVVFLTINSAEAQQGTNSDAAAMSRVFGEDIVRQNGRTAVAIARTMSDDPTAEYEYLVNWILPPYRPTLLRIDGYFAAADPTPESRLWRLGGEVESPALELIRVAKRAKQLDDLFRRLSELPDADDTQQRRKVALLALIEMARGRMDSANKLGDKLYELVARSNEPLAERWPELLFTYASHQVPALKDVSADIFEVLLPMQDSVPMSALGLHLQDIQARLEFSDSERLRHWHPSARATASTRDAGHPNTRWFASDGTVRCVTSHDVDYLHYQIPLAGNYEVEAEVSLIPNQNGVIFVGGQWLSIAEGAGLMRGDYHSVHGYFPFQKKPLPLPDTYLRYRTVVRGDQVTTFCNGREVDRREFGYAPWLALRNGPGNRGTVRDLQITGRPIVPEKVYPLLEGARSWKAYQDDADQRWATTDDHANGFITGKRIENVGHTSVESLAHYHRPILEGGVIEYEFFYQSGEYSAHPAIERLVFRLDAKGVRPHWVRDPSVRMPSTSTDSSPDSIPLRLKENDWNRVRLTIQGDQLQIAVNGVDAFQHTLIQRQRRLGLYYVGSESKLKVRNMIWTGDWPKSLPAPQKQELASDVPEFLAGLETMQEHTRIDFTKPIDRTRFDTPRSKARSYASPSGLRIEPDVLPGFSSYFVGDRHRISGDFDATLRFSNLTGSAETGQADFTLRFLDEHGNRYSAARSYRAAGEELAAMRWMYLGKTKKVFDSRKTGDESREGRLRLIRRGDTTYALIAHGDSDRFHLLGTRAVRDPVSTMGLRIEASRMKAGELSVVLEELVIRTSPPGSKELDPRVNALERVTREFRHRSIVASFQPTTREFAEMIHASVTESGIKMTADHDSALIGYSKALSGDFEITVDIGTLQLSDDSKFTIGLDVGDQPNKAELTLQPRDDNGLRITAQIPNRKNKDNNFQSNNMDIVDLDAVRTLRLVRLQRTIFFVCKGKTKSKVLGYADIGMEDIRPGSIQFTLASESQMSSLELEKIEIQSANP